MAGQLLNIADFCGVFSTPDDHQDAHNGQRARVYEFPASAARGNQDADGLQCARGARMALCMEVAAGLFLYVVWIACHMHR